MIVLYSGGFSEQPSWIVTLLAAISGLLAGISAWGFMRRDYLTGYGVGNAFGIFLLIYSVGFLAGKGSINPLEYFAWLSYPVILLVLLNLFYRGEFTDRRTTP
jgi:peptidoglycan/LPS O-acetylase OafA/YrhL